MLNIAYKTVHFLILVKPLDFFVVLTLEKVITDLLDYGLKSRFVCLNSPSFFSSAKKTKQKKPPLYFVVAKIYFIPPKLLKHSLVPRSVISFYGFIAQIS